jgi:hypothetical protein
MINNGVGGANTQTGTVFEINTDLRTNLINAGIDLTEITFLQKWDFIYFMREHKIEVSEVFGKNFLPDEAFIYHNHLFVIEKKYQKVSGSVDEKIQTGPYKKLVYETCAELAGLNGATYIYLLCSNFNNPKYTKHQIPYLRDNNIPVYFDNFPINEYFI